MIKYIRLGLALLLLVLLSACATMNSQNGDSPNVQVVGMNALPSEGFELRFALKLRVQNPNETALSYDGLAVKLELDGRGVANGVSNVSGEIERFSDTVLTVPVSISAFSAVREVISRVKDSQTDKQGLNQPIKYLVSGKLGAGVGKAGATRFNSSGEMDLFPSTKDEPPKDDSSS